MTLPLGHSHEATQPEATSYSRVSLDRVITAAQASGLRTRRAGRDTELWVQCPVHEDTNPSLHLTWVPDAVRGGKTLVFCQVCEARGGDVAEALGLTVGDLFDEPLPKELQQSRGGRRQSGLRRGRLGRLPKRIAQPTETQGSVDDQHEWHTAAEYAYRDASGDLVCVVTRKECRSCEQRHKDFPQVFYDTAGKRHWRLSDIPEEQRRPEVLYRLPELAAARAAGENALWVLEGEKDAEAAAELGLAATTNPRGGARFIPAYIAPLEGADVHLVLDRDDKGWERGITWGEGLQGHVRSVKLWLPAVTDRKADFSDHVDAGLDLAALVPVTVDRLRVWLEVSRVEKLARAAMEACDEVEAHRAAMTGAPEDSDPETHKRHARRWLLEAQARLEKLIRQEVVAGEVAVAVGQTEGGEEAHEASRRSTQTARDRVLALHEQSGEPVPQMLLPVPGPGERSPGVSDLPSGQPTSTVDPQHRLPDGVSQDDLGDPDGSLVSSPTFRIVGNRIVHWDPEAHKGVGELKLVLGLAVQVVAREFAEDATDSAFDLETPLLQGRSGGGESLNPPAPRRLTGMIMEYPHPETGELLRVRISAEEWQNHSWLDSLPGPPDHDQRKSGLDQVKRAVLAVSHDIAEIVRYTSTGWRPRPGQPGEWQFVHAGGAITADGTAAVPTLLGDSLARYNLPDPLGPDRSDELRRAWIDHSAGMLWRIPGRAAVPLLGQLFRSAMGASPFTLALVGPPGSYKTSIAAKVMHHWGELWDHSKPTVSMSGNGDTLNAMRLKLHMAKDSLFWMDDFAPTKGWVASQKLLEEAARLIHNREARGRSSRDGQSLLDGTGPRATGLATSEVLPRPGSGAERILVVPLEKEDISKQALFPLNDPESRYGRAVVMASFLRWFAQDPVTLHQHYCQSVAPQVSVEFQNAGLGTRLADALAQCAAGWHAVTDCLVDLGAITTHEQQRLLTATMDGLREAAEAAEDPLDPNRTGSKIKSMITMALEAGQAHLADIRTGSAPDESVASRLGWRRTGPERVDPQGTWIGWFEDHPDPERRRVYIKSGFLATAVKMAAQLSFDDITIDEATARRALASEGFLITQKSTNGRFIKHIPHWGHTAQTVAMRLDVLWDSPPEPDTGTDPDDSGDPSGGQDPFGAFAAIFGDVTPQNRDETTPLPLPSPAPDTSPDGVVEPVGGAVSEADVTVGAKAPVHDGGADRYVGGEDELFEDELTVFADADGIEASFILTSEPEVCRICGVESFAASDGVFVHPYCWRSSTQQSRSKIAAERPLPVPAGIDVAAEPEQPTTQGAPSASAVPTPDASPRSMMVVDADQVFCSDGTKHSLDSVQHLGDLVDLAIRLDLGTQATKWRRTPGVVMVTAALLTKLGLDTTSLSQVPPNKRDEAIRELTKNSDLVKQTLDAGWQIGGRDDSKSLGRWTRVWKGESQATWIAALPAFDQDPAVTPVLTDDPDPATIARRFGLFAQHLEYPFYLSSQTTGLDLMKTLRWKDRDRFFAPRSTVEPDQITELCSDPSWCRKPTQEESEHEWIHLYDRGGSYLAGATLELGYGSPAHYPDGWDFDRKLPAYLRIDIPEPGDWRVPHPLDPKGRQAGRPSRWTTTPAYEFALEQGYEPEILEAWVWHDHARVLEQWQKRLRDARMSLDVDDGDHQLARDLVKTVYTKTIGMMHSHTHMKGRVGYEPAWAAHIITKARINILRKINKVGESSDRWPVALVTDTIAYTSNEPDPVKAWPGDPKDLGRGLGQYSPEGSAKLADHLTYLTGGAYKGRDAIMQGNTADADAPADRTGDR